MKCALLPGICIPACLLAAATVKGRVTDAETGALLPCTVTIVASDGKTVTDHPAFRGGFRSNGAFEKAVPDGETLVTVSRGFDYIAAEEKLALKPDETRELQFRLRRRSPLRREGWYAGDNHAHMVHGERHITVDFPYLALAARAEGLDYLSLAQHWNVPRETPEALEKACRGVSTPDFLLTWNLEAPKNYFRGDVSKCLGHGWTAAARGRTAQGADAVGELLDLSAHDYESEKDPAPNFESHALIHSLGGIVSYTHPCRWWWGKWGGQGIYPVEEKKFVSNTASELPFDTVAGPTYDTLDVLMQPHEREANACAEKLWFMLLDRGYRIAASGSSDATFDRAGGAVPGKVRVYTRIEGPLTIAAAAEALKAGRSFVTTGPLLGLEMNGRGPGETLPAGARVTVRLRAWAPRLARVELVRNGAVAREFALDGRTELDEQFELHESERAWYLARAAGDQGQLAITNPVYFEAAEFKPPAASPARVTATVTDPAGRPLSGKAEVIRMVGRTPEVLRTVAFADGRFTLEAPATARLSVTVPGHPPMTKSIFMDYAPLLEATFALRAPDLTDWRTFEKFRELLSDVRLEFRGLATQSPSAATERPPFIVGPIQARAGESVSGIIDVPGGAELPVTVVHGAEAGPVLALVAGVHGYEYPPILALQKLRPQLDPARFRGTLILVHVANMPSFLGRTIYFSPIDGKNLNRVFPGRKDGTASERIAWAITTNVIDKCDYLVDLHCGDGNESLRPYLYQPVTGNAKLDRAAAEMALAWGLDHIVLDRGRPLDPAASIYCSATALSRGKPAMTVEDGWLGTGDPEPVERLVRGARSLMRHLKMIEGAPERVQNPVYLDPTEVLTSPATGILFPKVERGRYVARGAVLASIADFFGREIAVVRAPFDGVVLYVVATPPISKGQPVAFIGVPKSTGP